MEKQVPKQYSLLGLGTRTSRPAKKKNQLKSQKRMSPSPPPRLVAWLRGSTGALFSDLLRVGQSAVTGDNGRGLFASAAIPAGTRLITVPPPLWLPYSGMNAVREFKASNPPVFQRLEALAARLAPHQRQGDKLVESASLATVLLLERQQQQQQVEPHPYFEVLVHPGEHPLVCRDAEADALLTGSSVQRAIAHRRHLYTDVAETLFGGADPRIKGDFLWGMAQVLSRALSGGPQNMPLTLIPGVDMVNHSATHNAAVHFDASSATFSLAATHDVAEDDEVLISYGSGRDTASFMAVYGFFEKNNPNDVLKLALAPHREATLPLTLLLSLDGSYSALAATGPTGDIPADKVAELRRHADVVIASVKKGLGDALLAPARGVVRQASASAAGGTAEDSAVATLALKRCDDALAAFLPGPAGAAGVAAHQLPSPVAPAAEARLQFLLKEAATGTTQWRRHCAVAASRELDGLLRLRATCQAYCTALSVRNS